MADFLAYVKEYWQYFIALAVAIAVLGFAFLKARKSYRRYYSRYRAEEKEITRLKALKEQYEHISALELRNVDDDSVTEGVALALQLKLQKEDNMEKAFALLSSAKQYVYTLDIFLQSENAAEFFRENGAELTELIVPALEFIGAEEQAKQAERLRIMFDEKDDTTSINAAVIDEVNEYFAAEKSNIKDKSAKMIKENAAEFATAGGEDENG